jgi:endonuclease/exonuclease/phosphatase family metal-dependent hydrolase
MTLPIFPLTPEENSAHLRLATYNVHTCVGRDGFYHPERVLKVIKEINADVIGLQEVSAHHRPDGIPDQFEFFEQSTGFFAVPGHSIIEGKRRYGNALLSRYPIETLELIDISVPPYERRGAIHAVIRTECARVHVLVTHLGLRVRERKLQIAKLAAHLPTDKRMPSIVMGDFNYWGPVARWAFGPLSCDQAARSSPKSFPSRFPLLALDRIRARGESRIYDLRAHKSSLSRQASDHLPVVCEMEIPANVPEAERVTSAHPWYSSS